MPLWPTTSSEESWAVKTEPRQGPQELLPSPRLLGALRGSGGVHARDGCVGSRAGGRTRGQLESASAAAVGDSSSQQSSLLQPTRAAALPAGTRSAVRVGERGSRLGSLHALFGNCAWRAHASPSVPSDHLGRGASWLGPAEAGKRPLPVAHVGGSWRWETRKPHAPPTAAVTG
jgi:hypothetical protein